MGILDSVFGGGKGDSIGPQDVNFKDYGNPGRALPAHLQGRTGKAMSEISKPFKGQGVLTPQSQLQGEQAGVVPGAPNISGGQAPAASEEMRSNVPVLSSEMLKLGDLSKRYEVGVNGGPGTINLKEQSYGSYQMYAKAGVVQRFIKEYGYSETFAGLKPGSSEFNAQWKATAASDSKFDSYQHSFIKKSHYTPVRDAADGYNIPNNPAVNQALWSIGVQHGGYKKILKGANVASGDSPATAINKLYDSRTRYVRGIGMPSLKNRYDTERADALKMLGRF